MARASRWHLLASHAGRNVAPGTQAYLRTEPECDGLFTPRRITHLIAHYGQYLPTCVKVTVGSKTSDMTQTPPWTLLNGTGRDSLLDYGREAFGVNFIDAVPLHSAAGGVEGVAYVLPKAVSASSRQQHRIYLKGMLLSEQGEKLLPDWAFFVRCIVSVTGLRPTASRSHPNEDEALEQARTTLGHRASRVSAGSRPHRSKPTDPTRLDPRHGDQESGRCAVARQLSCLRPALAGGDLGRADDVTGGSSPRCPDPLCSHGGRLPPDSPGGRRSPAVVRGERRATASWRICWPS